MGQAGLSDSILVGRAQKGSRDAMDELVSRYEARAYQFAYRLCGNSDDASDLVAESFLRVYTALAKFRQESQFSTWLYRIITNCFLDKRKREKNKRHEALDDAVGPPEDTLNTSIEVETPVESSERLERESVMQEAIQQLPEYQRAMIVMYHIEMLSYEQIAEALDTPIGTVKSRLNRARLALRDLLEPNRELFQS